MEAKSANPQNTNGRNFHSEISTLLQTEKDSASDSSQPHRNCQICAKPLRKINLPSRTRFHCRKCGKYARTDKDGFCMVHKIRCQTVRSKPVTYWRCYCKKHKGQKQQPQPQAKEQGEQNQVNEKSSEQQQEPINEFADARSETASQCRNCENGKASFMRKRHTQYRCDTCKLLVNGMNRICKNHPHAGSYPNDHPQKMITRSCHVCSGTGFLESIPVVATATANNNEDDSSSKSTAATGMVKALDKLQKTIKFDRKFMRTISDSSSNPLKLIKTIVQHIKKYQPKTAIEAFREAWLPVAAMEAITSKTDCDKWVEKTKIGNVIMWALTMFLENKTEALAIQDIADASTSLLGRTLSQEEGSVDHNSLGVRLEKPELIRGLEMVLQLCSTQLGANAFEENGALLNIYYDWFYLVKSGNEWQVCQELGRTKESYGLKIGIGIEWESKAIVALTMHGEHHSNDAVSFREELMLTQRAGLVHISDLGPFSSETMIQIHKNRQYFIIKLKKNVKYQQIHQIFLGLKKFQLETASKTKIRLLEEKLIRLEVNPELGDLKYIRFQYNSLKTGQFKMIELITSLPLSAEQIIRAHALRWTATETEFRILQHQFGLEKLFIKKPQKAWPLLLLVLCGKMLMELTYRSIHILHGGTKTQSTHTAPFRRGFTKFVNAVLLGIEDPFELIEPCDDVYCCFRNNHGQRRK